MTYCLCVRQQGPLILLSVHVAHELLNELLNDLGTTRFWCNLEGDKIVLAIRQPYQFWIMLAARRDYMMFVVQASAC